jgi:8-oxo-dGTP pyrophosphatase MutT (NUDIX family)
MIEFEILARGLYRPDQLVITYDPSLRMPTTPAIQQWMDTLWQQKLASAQQEGYPLYDSQLFRFVHAEAWREGQVEEGNRVGASPTRTFYDGEHPTLYSSGPVPQSPSPWIGDAPLQSGDPSLRSPSDRDRLHLVLGDTSYKEYTTTRVPEFAEGHSRQELSNALAVCSVIETSDGSILYERRRRVAVYVGRYHVIGGFFERDLDTTTTSATNPDPFAAIRREIREETGIQAADIAEQYCLGVVYDVATPHAEACFLTRLCIPLNEVHQRVPEDDEIQQLLSFYVTQESLRDFILTNHGNISATGEPNLLLYGAVKFGEGWFEEMMARLVV